MKAAVDIGTNSVKMVIGWHETDGTLRSEDVTPIVTRLGKGVDKTGKLDDAAMQRTADALKGFAERARQRGVTTIKAVGTSALRDAENGAEFVRRAEEILGGRVEVISGDQEADLVFRAAQVDAKPFAPDAAILVTTDVGGGSTEIVIGRGEERLFRKSLQLGAVRLTERSLHSDPPTSTEQKEAIVETDVILSEVPRPEGGMAVIASGGTAANLGALHLAPSYPDAKSPGDLLEQLHGLSLSVLDIEALIQRLVGMPLAERRGLRGLEPDRADVIIGGAIIQARILRHLHLERLFVSAHGLRYGLLYEILAQPGA